MCAEIPVAVSDIKAKSTFPVIIGTVVEVNCKPGYKLAGDNTLTYIKDVSFNISQRPTSTIGLIFYKLLKERF